MKVDLYSETGTKLSAKTELPKEIFGIVPNETVLRQCLHIYQVNQRRGTAKAKTRGEVSGGGRKPWRQKGTGKARHGSIRSPIWVGGGIAHGPKPRKFALSIPRKIAQLALKSALSLKAHGGRVKVLRDLVFKEPKTVKAAGLLEKLKLGKRVLVVLPESDENLYRSFRNIEKVEVRVARELNVYDTVLADDLILLEKAIGKLGERLVEKRGDQLSGGRGESKEPVAGKGSRTAAKRTRKTPRKPKGSVKVKP